MARLETEQLQQANAQLLSAHKILKLGLLEIPDQAAAIQTDVTSILELFPDLIALGARVVLTDGFQNQTEFILPAQVDTERSLPEITSLHVIEQLLVMEAQAAGFTWQRVFIK